MKRKRTPHPATEKAMPPNPLSPEKEVLLIPPGLIDEARKAYDSAAKMPSNCTVCGDPCAPNSTEGLCWVCRRLKLSAWRDTDLQTAIQE